MKRPGSVTPFHPVLIPSRPQAITAALQGWGPASHLLPTLVGCLGALPGPAGTGGAAGGGGGASAEDAAADVQAECVICYAYRYPGEARWFKPPTRMCFASALPPLPFDSDMTHADKVRGQSLRAAGISNDAHLNVPLCFPSPLRARTRVAPRKFLARTRNAQGSTTGPAWCGEPPGSGLET